MYHRFFWYSIAFDDSDLFDFLINDPKIDVHCVSKQVFDLHEDEIYYFRGFHANAWTFLLAAYKSRGESKGLIRMRDALRSRGVNAIPPLGSSGGGGCCEVY
jgi:hypothetical protein